MNNNLPNEAIPLPGEPIITTEQELTELEIFREKCFSMRSQAAIMAVINPQRYGEMKRYIDMLTTDIDAFYTAFESRREGKLQ